VAFEKCKSAKTKLKKKKGEGGKNTLHPKAAATNRNEAPAAVFSNLN